MEPQLPPQLFVCVDFSFFVYTNRLLVWAPENDTFVCGAQWAIRAKQLEGAGYDLKRRCGVVSAVSGRQQTTPEEFWPELAQHKGVKLNKNGRSFVGEHLPTAMPPIVALSMGIKQKVDLLVFCGPESGLNMPRNESVTSASWIGEGMSCGQITGWVRSITLVFPAWLRVLVGNHERLMPTRGELDHWTADHPPVHVFWYDEWPGVETTLAAGTFLARNPAVTPPWTDDQFVRLTEAQPFGQSVIVGPAEADKDTGKLRLPTPQVPRPYDPTSEGVCEDCRDLIENTKPAFGLAPADPEEIEIMEIA